MSAKRAEVSAIDLVIEALPRIADKMRLRQELRMRQAEILGEVEDGRADTASLFNEYDRIQKELYG